MRSITFGMAKIELMTYPISNSASLESNGSSN